MEDEIEVIWKRKFSGPSFLYLAMRICTLGYILLGTSLTFAPTTVSVSTVSPQILRLLVFLRVECIFQGCKRELIVRNIFLETALFAYAAFNTLRVWAIWGRHWFPVVVVFPLSLIPLCINAHLASRTFIVGVEPNPIPVGICLGGIRETQAFFSLRGSILVTDALILALTWARSYRIRKAATEAGVQANLATLIIRDGTLYFGVHFLVNMITIITNYTLTLNPSPASSFSNPLTSILFCRFILNLRTYDSDKGGTHADESQNYSTINFAASISGNIGAPLDHSTSSSDDTLNSSEYVSMKPQTGNPLAVGILDVPPLAVPLSDVDEGVRISAPQTQNV
ncbi:hypothetical protein NLI96_g11181 [Meripilus lineatus]|uniref:Transmembrane protein n=1 Tax=Meripilus lineatus TaxID=2056292 RepID=A0AAD5USC1_9APHY|nr:hypothetical protein NLI96_g11181 [Physisporinus lineatus]